MLLDRTFQHGPQFAMTPAGSSVTRVHVCATPLVRTGVQQILDGTHFVLADPTRESPAQPEGHESPAADLFIIDKNYLPEGVLELIAELKARHPAAHVVVLADHFEIDTVVSARLAGADGFCLTASCRDVLIHSLELVMLGEVVLPSELVVAIIDNSIRSIDMPFPASAEKFVSAAPQRPLSSREVEVLSLLRQGAPNKVIARKLDVAEATVKVHVKTILRKIGVHNRAQAAIWAAYHMQLEAPLE